MTGFSKGVTKIEGEMKFVSGAELARIAEIPRQKVYKLYKAGYLSRDENKNYPLVDSLKIIEQNRIFDKNIGDKSSDKSSEITGDELQLNNSTKLDEARRINEILKAKLQQLEYEQKKGDWISRQETISFLTQMISIVKSKIMGVSANVAPEVVAMVGSETAKKIKTVYDDEIKIVLTELAKLNDVSTSNSN